MMFKPENRLPQQPAPKRRRQISVNPRALVMLLVGVLLVVGLFCGFKFVGSTIRHHRAHKTVRYMEAENNHFTVERTRLCRDQIKPINVSKMNYREMFDDLNDIQLEIATKNGLKNPEQITDLDDCEQLVRLNSCELFRIDTMYYSKPYLIPEAVLLLRYIGIRFQEVLKEHYPDNKHHYRLIVTSALRSENDVSRLRHSNRNATEKSCHRFGTTMDISYIRFEQDGKEDVNEQFLKDMLALTLYELRQEGLCYVKYERGQSCFHLTVRNTEYKGKLRSQKQTFPDSAGVVLEEWGDNGSLAATEAMTREYRQNGTIHGKKVGEAKSAKKSAAKAVHKVKKTIKKSTKSTKESIKSAVKNNTSQSSTQTKTEHYREVPAAGKSGNEEIMAW